MRSILSWFLVFSALHGSVHQDLTEVASFGENPGSLRMFFHAPAVQPQGKRPLVLVLHGCTQSARRIAEITGWNELADHDGFYVLYPEQRGTNNAASCFSWFKPEDIVPGQGEAASIRNMVTYAVANWPVDPERVYITGVSAGGGMTAVMLACYPEVFQAGAVLAGFAYRAAREEGFGSSLVHDPDDFTPTAWGALVSKLHPAGTKYPRMVIEHGTSDGVVDIRNADALIAQWTALHGCDTVPESVTSDFEGHKGVRKSIYRNEAGIVLTFYRIDDLGHQIPVDPGPPPRQGGKKTRVSPDIGWHSTYAVAKEFGIVE